MGITWNTFWGGQNWIDSFAALDDSVAQPTTSSFVLQEGNFTLVFQGAFTTNMWGLITGGTITGFRGYVGGTKVLEATGYSLDYQQFTVARLGQNPLALADLLWGSGVTIDGSQFGDLLLGGPTPDVLNGMGGNDDLFGEAGNDFIAGGGGKDKMWGGDGVDTVSYTDHVDPVSVVLNGNQQTIVKVGGVGEDTISGFENVIGGGGNDRLAGDGLNNMLVGMNGDDKLLGNDGNDLLSGGDGRDKIIGGKGNDQITGGNGNDILTGGKDSDSFMFNTALDRRENVDLIKDFKPGVDSIVLAHTVFTALAPGALKGKYFKIGKKAKDGNDYVIYDKGELSYDADGKGGEKAILFAKLKGAPDIDAGDFLVI